MAPLPRREILAIAGGTLTLLAGCSTRTEVGTATEAEAPFSNLSIAEAPMGCPVPEYASRAKTPIPYPTPSVPSNDERAADLAVDMEAVYLTNRVIVNRTPNPTPTRTRNSTAAPTVDYPAVEATYDDRTVYRSDGGAIVHLEYVRTVGGDRQGTYTVNYYFADGGVARAEAGGYSSPGPHPTEDGVRLTCWE